MKSVFQERLEFVKSIFNTRHGILIWLIESLIFGYILVNYTTQIYIYLNNLISIQNIFLREYVSYLFFGFFLVLLGLITTFILTKIFDMLFKNSQFIK